MRRKQTNPRAWVIISLLAAVVVSLGFRLVQLHVLQSDELRAEAIANTERVIKREGRRGGIVDINGNLLANTVTKKIVTADPSITVSNATIIARSLSPLLDIAPDTLYAKLTIQGRYVRLKKRVDDEIVQQIRSLKLKGIHFEDQFVRSYPNENLASHVLGFVNSEHKGMQGIEASMESYLQGRAGYDVIKRDRKGREIRALREESIGSRDGYDVILTLDQVIQHITETELDRAMTTWKPQAGVIIVSRPNTGEILAMTSRPTFNPNYPGNAPAEARRNRCISDVAEPGSTFKVMVIGGAIDDKIVSLHDKFDCENGAFVYAGRALHDSHPYGDLSVEEILYHSSNIGAAKIALRMGPTRLHDHIIRFGFGRKTGVPLPGEVSGIVHPLSRWSKLSITRIPMGHEIAVTPIQMSMAVNAVANGGNLMKPMIIKKIVSEDGASVVEYRPERVSQCVSKHSSALITDALRKVVAPGGTAPKAAVENYDVAGKTGTAQKIENGQYVRRYYSSFVGYLPASDPEISILVILDDPTQGSYYGGTVAGPVFRSIAEKVAQYLGIIPQPNLTHVASVS